MQTVNMLHLREDIEKKISELRSYAPASDDDRIFQMIQTAVRNNPPQRLIGWKRFLILKPHVLMPTFLAVLLALGISGSTVAVAQNDLPDEPLYPLKLWSERAVEKIAFTNSQKVQLAERHAVRRADELSKLIERGPKRGIIEDHFTKSVDRMADRLNTAEERIRTIATTHPERAATAAALLEVKVDAMHDAIDTLRKRSGSETLPEKLSPLIETIEKTEESVGELLSETRRNASPEGVKQSAQGMLRAVENKAEVIQKKIGKLEKQGLEITGEVAKAIDQAEEKQASAQTYFAHEQYTEAFATGKEAIRFYIEAETKFRIQLGTQKRQAKSESKKESSDDSRVAPQEIKVNIDGVNGGIIKVE
ncbi:MAG: hypothetical protein Q8P82_00810 [bacterium]|nr:hypothetical protein [bacterium]